MDHQTAESRQTLEEAFENIIILELPSPYPDDDWMPGEFDIE